MKAVSVKKKKVAVVVRRKPSRKVEEQTKIKIAKERYKTGTISCLQASRKCRVSRYTIKAWAGKLNLTTLLNADNTSAVPGMAQSQESKLLLGKIHKITKALELLQKKSCPTSDD